MGKWDGGQRDLWHLPQVSVNAFFLVVWLHAPNLIQQDCSQRQCRCIDCVDLQNKHILLQHKRQFTEIGSWLLHVARLYMQKVSTLLSLLQAG